MPGAAAWRRRTMRSPQPMPPTSRPPSRVMTKYISVIEKDTHALIIQ
jgi:hypothetical protein